MQGDASPPPTQLQYAAPARPSDLLVRHGPDRVDFEVGPMPTSLFVATIVPHALYLAAVVGGMVWLLYTTRFASPLRSPIAWFAIALALASATVNVFILSVHRLVPRAVGATSNGIYFSDARTGGRPRTLRWKDVSAVGVRRRWWSPWVAELVAVPPHRFLTFKAESSAPTVLLSGLDRAALQQIASDLRHAPAAAARNPDA